MNWSKGNFFIQSQQWCVPQNVAKKNNFIEQDLNQAWDLHISTNKYEIERFEDGEIACLLLLDPSFRACTHRGRWRQATSLCWEVWTTGVWSGHRLPNSFYISCSILCCWYMKRDFNLSGLQDFDFASAPRPKCGTQGWRDGQRWGILKSCHLWCGSKAQRCRCSK